MGGLIAKGLEGVDGVELGFAGQFAGEQQQQLAQLQGEAAAQQGRLVAGQAVEGK